MRVGIFDHFGWAIAVTATTAGNVVDRRRIALIGADLSPAPIHYDADRLDDDGLAALVARVRADATRTTATALDDLERSLPGTVASMALRAWDPDFPDDLATLRRAPYEARADAIMYRRVLADVAHRRGWAVHHYDARTVLALAADRLGDRADDVLTGPRQKLGPPWTKDHRVALAAAILSA